MNKSQEIRERQRKELEALSQNKCWIHGDELTRVMTEPSYGFPSGYDFEVQRRYPYLNNTLRFMSKAMIKKILSWIWKGNADESIEQKEYKSMSGLVEEFGEEQERDDIDTVFDNLESNQEERIKPIRFRINDTEDGYLSPDALQIDGASYVEGMDDYEWIFQIASKDFESLLKLLKKTEELSDDIPNELMNYLKENGTKVSEIRELCQDNEIEHYFQNWF